mmetsp:Transcript_86536/g.280172  ORF Transcript_86536/g.280172 Transcript_86536/m.280172 type:complete len:136 (+) Transcript_86536:964-1371(+)
MSVEGTTSVDEAGTGCNASGLPVGKILRNSVAAKATMDTMRDHDSALPSASAGPVLVWAPRTWPAGSCTVVAAEEWPLPTPASAMQRAWATTINANTDGAPMCPAGSEGELELGGRYEDAARELRRFQLVDVPGA